LGDFLAEPGPELCSVRITVPNEEIGFAHDSAILDGDGTAAIEAMVDALAPDRQSNRRVEIMPVYPAEVCPAAGRVDGG
jgi:hypothetical protein